MAELVNCAGLTYTQVVGMGARELQIHLIEKELTNDEIVSIKRLRKRERIKRKTDAEISSLGSSLEQLSKFKYCLMKERSILAKEVSILKNKIFLVDDSSINPHIIPFEVSYSNF